MEPPHTLKIKPKIERPDGDETLAAAFAEAFEDTMFSPQQEEDLLARIKHREQDVEAIQKKIDYYQSQLEDAQRKLLDARADLARFQSSKTGERNGLEKLESASSSPVGINGAHPLLTMPRLVIPAIDRKTPTPPVETRIRRVGKTDIVPSGAGIGATRPSSSSASAPLSSEPISERQSGEPREKRTKKNPGRKEHRDLISSICTCSSPRLISFKPSKHVSSQHKRKLRSLVVNPVNDKIFATSALDGDVNLWQVQIDGPSASLLSTTNCVSTKQRRWPEDLTWHPDGGTLFAAYSADGGDSQISMLNLNFSGEGFLSAKSLMSTACEYAKLKRKAEKKVIFSEEKPHLKGIINSIMFMPWVDLCFVTGGSDHAVVAWSEEGGSWKPKVAHKNEHSSAVMGVAGLQQKKILMSAGADKRIIGFDLVAGRPGLKYQIESKCMSVLPNPSDYNLFMVQTGVHGKQLRLFDIRLPKPEIRAFGWMQESSESQSALINQSWSPDGWYIFSGSADPKIHIFDIRYCGQGPSQSVQAHKKRVFKAVWQESLRLLTSISSDLNIGLHRIT